MGSLSCWNTALRPSLRREGIMLCFSTSQYILAFMVPSMNCSSPVPKALMQPQTVTRPPPCLIVGKTHLSLYSSPGCRHTRLTLSEPNKFILVSSDQCEGCTHFCEILCTSIQKFVVSFFIYFLFSKVALNVSVSKVSVKTFRIFQIIIFQIKPVLLDLYS